MTIADEQRGSPPAGRGPGTRHHRVAIVGAGFSGVGMAIRLKQEGIDDFVVLERAAALGGTWRDNSYPGCACDVPSHLYSYSFAPNPDWSRTFSGQAEIWRYLHGCAERFGVLPHVEYDSELLRAEWDDAGQRWRVETARGSLTASALVVATGPLSEPTLPNVPGIADFAGPVFHSASWDHEHDLAGLRVAVVGTGASAIQIVPRLQPRVERLHVLQRTPPWVMPRGDRDVTGLERAVYARVPLAQRLMRYGIYLSHEALVPPFMGNERLRRLAERRSLAHMEKQVSDPDLRRRLTPPYALGCKRVLISNDWYPALTQPNVEVISDALAEVRPRSIVTRGGEEREIDALVLATGFHATDPPWAGRVRGRDGRLVSERWGGSPRAYKGTTVAGCPNMFVLFGPNTVLAHSSVVFMVEAQVRYAIDCLRTLERRRATSAEVTAEAEDAWNADVQRRLRGSVWEDGGCGSWYHDANGRNAAIWPGFTWRFWSETRRFDAERYLIRAGVRTAAPA